jgi:type III restriction enzyme
LTQSLDKREGVKLFVKLLSWFRMETPVTVYHPVWAIVKVADEKLYLVRMTISTRDFIKLRNSEVDKVRCGQAHFWALGLRWLLGVQSYEFRDFVES